MKYFVLVKVIFADDQLSIDQGMFSFAENKENQLARVESGQKRLQLNDSSSKTSPMSDRQALSQGRSCELARESHHMTKKIR